MAGESREVSGENESTTLHDGGSVRATGPTGQTDPGVRGLTEGEIQESQEKALMIIMKHKKQNKSKTNQTVPTPSESTPVFEKKIVTDYFYFPTKSNMSSKERKEDLARFLEKIIPSEE